MDFYGFEFFMIRDLKSSSLFFRGIPIDRFYRSVGVPRFAVWRFPSPDCTHFVRLSGVIEIVCPWHTRAVE